MSKNRLVYVDAVRGIAILFMVQVHTASIIPPESISRSHPLGLLSAIIGGLAAPLFVMLSGWGSQRATERRVEQGGLTRWIVVRVAFLSLAQFVVNLTLPQRFLWYSPGVLTLLALCAIIAPLSGKIVKNRRFQIPFILLLAFSSWLFDPSLVIDSWQEMVAASSPMDWLYKLLIGGTYPLFPWLSLFVIGQTLSVRESELAVPRKSDKSEMVDLEMGGVEEKRTGQTDGVSVAGRKGASGVYETNYDLMLAFVVPLIAAMIFIPHDLLVQTYSGALLTFFPASPWFILAAAFFSMLIVKCVIWSEGRLPNFVAFLSHSGRLSLSIYVAHFVVLRILAEVVEGRLPLTLSFSLTLIHMALWLVLARIWMGKLPNYSLERLVRLLAR